jgi:hypothetical protein
MMFQIPFDCHSLMKALGYLPSGIAAIFHDEKGDIVGAGSDGVSLAKSFGQIGRIREEEMLAKSVAAKPKTQPKMLMKSFRQSSAARGVEHSEFVKSMTALNSKLASLRASL